MPIDVFTQGVKPGGLNTSKEIRILLCYLLNSVSLPVTMSQLENALWGEELVNYFELAVSLADLCDNEFILKQGDEYTLLPKGKEIADELSFDLPLTVKETALRAVVQMQSLALKQALHKVEIETLESGYKVHGWIDENGDEVFRFAVFMPDKKSANFVKNQFVLHGDSVYAVMLAGITGNVPLIEKAFDTLEKGD